MDFGKVALTGGIATGKSTVARMFAELGVLILDADRIARELVRPGLPCWHQLRELLSAEYFDSQGRLERRMLRQRIIDDARCRERVNSILHPAVVAAMEGEWENQRHANPQRQILFDIPLLFEAGLAHRFDVVVVVYAPPAVQIQRLMERDGVSRQQAEQTLTMQLPIESKKSRAHLVIDNSRELAYTRTQVRTVWKQIFRPQWPVVDA